MEVKHNIAASKMANNFFDIRFIFFFLSIA